MKSYARLPGRSKGLLALLVFFTTYFSLSTSPAEIAHNGATIAYLREQGQIADEKNKGRHYHHQKAIERGRRKQERARRKAMHKLKFFHKLKHSDQNFVIQKMLHELPQDQLLNRFHKQPRQDIGNGGGGKDIVCKHTEVANQIDSSCHKLLSPYAKSSPAWFFFGDSQMYKLSEQIQYPYEITNYLESEDTRCSFLDFINLKKAEQWIPPPFKIVGPTTYGLAHPFCSDAGSPNTLRESNTLDGNNFMEFLQVPYAKSVEQQTDYTDTTQETAVMHIANQLQLRGLTYEDSVCVVNSGLHDQKLCYGKDDEWCLQIYYDNVKWYLELLDNVCGSIIWISTTPVMDDPVYQQKNNRIMEWNQMVKETLASYKNGFYVDIWDAASHHDHLNNDNVHFVPEYYVHLGNLFSSLM